MKQLAANPWDDFTMNQKKGDKVRGSIKSITDFGVFKMCIRDRLFRQRVFRRAPGLVADGRDMGSVVFPDALTKVFLTASVEVRAERRHKQLIEKGIAASILPLLLDLRERDQRDSQRSVAPLQQSEDANLLDTTDLTIEQAVSQVLSWSKQGA